ncbi:AP endonuclease 1 [Saprolegnia diclina VS20]|uniref:AP endonuclease 1 n=1 Tax=Saprolegnia diclina (strain VS20) TaxID=1156394 RepID=T0QHK6_SAPDV|nr:AP endonuclease 1 [Saprolegnia diclina VS20]EQC34231.1 AP endonuclease 1 [Saprolegnia diclina VS20]|eukprot:XP_008612543.1 AP endonuclease 1 [Saprolegnia diclina VS20]
MRRSLCVLARKAPSIGPSMAMADTSVPKKANTVTRSAIPPKESKVAAKRLAKEAAVASDRAQSLATLQARREATMHTNKLLGAHVSSAGGLENAVFNAAKIGARAFALFTRSQRTWACKPLEPATIDAFKQAMRDFGYAPGDVVPHGSYLLNCGSPDDATLAKSRAGLLDEVLRCEQLGLSLYNFHPGSTRGAISIDACLDRIAESIAGVLQATSRVTILVENMSCQGSTIGGHFSELRGILDRIPAQHADRIGVCLDTCHAFAAGWDIKDAYEATMTTFDETVGLQYLKALHLNDSKGVLGCHADRHEAIGKGHIGLGAFELLMNDPRFNDVPMILETPVVDDEAYAAEIALLYNLCKR